MAENALQKIADIVTRRLVDDLNQINDSVRQPDGTVVFLNLSPEREKRIWARFEQLLKATEVFPARIHRPIEWAKRRIVNAIRPLPEYPELVPLVNRVVDEKKLQDISIAVRGIRRRLDPDREPAARARGGRPRRLAGNFVGEAGTLWRGAQDDYGNVSDAALAQIAPKLDAKGYVPPADYLEPKAALEVKRFNSTNSNSRVGPIMTWLRLVEIGDKDHLRGMRRLLSRCAEKLIMPRK